MYLNKILKIKGNICVLTLSDNVFYFTLLLLLLWTYSRSGKSVVASKPNLTVPGCYLVGEMQINSTESTTPCTPTPIARRHETVTFVFVWIWRPLLENETRDNVSIASTCPICRLKNVVLGHPLPTKDIAFMLL